MTETKSAKHSEFTPSERLIFEQGYRLGQEEERKRAERILARIDERENRRNVLLSNMSTTHYRLWKELTRACREQPLAGEGIILCFDNAEKIIKALRKPQANYYWAKKLLKMIRTTREQTYRSLDDIENELIQDDQ